MAYSCTHLATAVNIPISVVKNSKELVCSDCNCHGPNLWICLHKNCLQIGCSEKSNDHSTRHNEEQPTHCVHKNLTTKRIWCYECKREVFMPSYDDSDQETESCTIKSRDSGHGSYSTLRTNTPEREYVPEGIPGINSERNIGIPVSNVSDSSEGEEECVSSTDRYETFAPIPSTQGLVGLQNIGNTCYMNAALQALSNTEPLTRFFLDCANVVHILSEGKKPGLSRAYQALVRDMWTKRGGQGYVTPSGILYGIRSVHATFRGYQQHDTQEFLRNFMDQLHEELKRPALQPDMSNPALPSGDADNFSLAMDDMPVIVATSSTVNSYDSSEGEEYETCDSGVSERSSLSDDTERANGISLAPKRRLSRCNSPNRKQRQRIQSSCVIDAQPTSSNSNKKQPKYRSIISDIFDGKLLSSVQCLTCDRISSRVETFQDLSLPIPSRDHLLVLHGRSAAPGATCSDALMPVQDGWIAWIVAWLKSWFYGPTITLHDCLAAFFSTDELKGDNMYSCEKCNKLRNGIKFSKVLQLPEVLCIHLKRFRHELMFSSKISAAVSFPLNGLDMRPYLHTECVSKISNYVLFSVICHHGTAGGGHYICFACNSGQWYEFDDQYVTKVSPEKVQTCEAYVLFYQKVSGAAEDVRDQADKVMDEYADTVNRTYISRQWINRFYFCSEPGPIDNSDFLCHHGSLTPDGDIDLDKIAMVIPYELYDYLYKKFGGCPPLVNLTFCHVCLALQKRLMFEMETFLHISREAQSQDTPHTHYLSTHWYSQWHNFVQKKCEDPPGPIDNSKINLSQLDLNEAADVPENIWNFFYNIYGGGPEIRIKVEQPESDEEIISDLPEMRHVQVNEDDTNTHRRSDSNSSINTTSEFVIPKRKNKTPAKNTIDKNTYEHGEPMETHCNSSTKETEVNGLIDDTMETALSKQDNEALEQISREASNLNLANTDTDIDEEEGKQIRNSEMNKRHRRRKKNLVMS